MGCSERACICSLNHRRICPSNRSSRLGACLTVPPRAPDHKISDGDCSPFDHRSRSNSGRRKVNPAPLPTPPPAGRARSNSSPVRVCLHPKFCSCSSGLAPPAAPIDHRPAMLQRLQGQGHRPQAQSEQKVQPRQLFGLIEGYLSSRDSRTTVEPGIFITRRPAAQRTLVP